MWRNFSRLQNPHTGLQVEISKERLTFLSVSSSPSLGWCLSPSFRASPHEWDAGTQHNNRTSGHTSEIQEPYNQPTPGSVFTGKIPSGERVLRSACVSHRSSDRRCVYFRSRSICRELLILARLRNSKRTKIANWQLFDGLRERGPRYPAGASERKTLFPVSGLASAPLTPLSIVTRLASEDCDHISL